MLLHLVSACAVLLAVLCLGAGIGLVWRAEEIATARQRRFLQRARALGDIPVTGLVIQRRWAQREEETSAGSLRRPATVRLAGIVLVLIGLTLVLLISGL